ncbi:hypothetical protein Q7M43_02835 [Candidatus Liberibacter asiaticus]
MSSCSDNIDREHKAGIEVEKNAITTKDNEKKRNPFQGRSSRNPCQGGDIKAPETVVEIKTDL